MGIYETNICHYFRIGAIFNGLRPSETRYSDRVSCTTNRCRCVYTYPLQHTIDPIINTQQNPTAIHHSHSYPQPYPPNSHPRCKD